MSGDARRRLTGWGGTAPTVARVLSPRRVDEVRAAVVGAGSRGVIARGLGRSYGDAAQNAGGDVLDLTGLDGVVEVDTVAPAVRVSGGTSLDDLMRSLLPHGLWMPVVPGTRQVTVGGAVAADIHGKNHHVDGSFGRHVRSMDLLLASGDIVRLTPTGPEADLFWATIGGMGLTGVVLEATISLRRVETASFVVDTVRTPDLSALLETLSGPDDDRTYSVAWFDTATTGDSLGRAVLTRGEHARLQDLDPHRRSSALRFAAPSIGRVPVRLPVSLVNRWSARAFNAAWYAKAPAHRTGEVQDITTFFHPLDAVRDWNRLYGRAGFCQYQFVVPLEEVAAFTSVVETIARSSHVSSLNVLKRFGPGNASPMSFPIEGWTLAVDLPVRPGLDRLLDELDALVLGARGRVYLAKDSRAGREAVAQMYPRADEFRAMRDLVDPNRVFRSDLSRRLDL